MLFTAIKGPFEGAAAMSGATVGGLAGALLGSIASFWFVYRDAETSHGHRFVGVGITALVTAAIMWGFYLVSTNS